MACTIGFKRHRTYEEKELPLKKRPSKEVTYMSTALLVDSDAASLLEEQSMLVSLGIDTLALNRAQDALQLLGVGARFDFIVVDFDLSIINGPEFVRRIRAMGLQNKVLGMCINYNAETNDMFNAAGVDATIGKPFTTEILDEVIGYLWNL